MRVLGFFFSHHSAELAGGGESRWKLGDDKNNMTWGLATRQPSVRKTNAYRRARGVGQPFFLHSSGKQVKRVGELLHARRLDLEVIRIRIRTEVPSARKRRVLVLGRVTYRAWRVSAAAARSTVTWTNFGSQRQRPQRDDLQVIHE
jgi:hypothetical protein